MTNAKDFLCDRAGANPWLALVFIVGLASRISVVFLIPEGLHRDTDAYRLLAETLSRSGVYGFPTRPERDATSIRDGQATPSGSSVRPTAFRPPLYPLLLSLFVVDGGISPFAIGALNVVCGLLTIYGVWLLGRQWELGSCAGIAAILTALDPILLYQSAQIMTETLATLCSVGCLLGLTYWMQKPTYHRGLLAGLLMAVACLCRPTFLPWGALVLISCWFVEASASRDMPGTGTIRTGMIRSLGPARGSPDWKLLAPLLLGLVVGMFPWGLRNYLQLGQWKFTTTHGGYTLLLGNNPDYYEFLRTASWSEVWDSKDLDRAWARRNELRNSHDDLFALANPRLPEDNAVRGTENTSRTEFDDDQLAYDFAHRYIRENKPMFLYSCLHRIGSLWHVLPHQVTPEESTARRLVRWAIAGWYCIVFGLALAGCWRIRKIAWRAPWLWGFLLCAVFTSVHAFYWSNMRMRAPLTPFIALLVAASFMNRPQRVARTP